MSAVVNFQNDSSVLESALTALLKYGKPRVMFMSKGWHCSVEMNTTAEGARFDVGSAFDMKTPSEAVAQCRTRIEETLKLYKDKS